jgi:hypothetical protein
MKQYSTDKCLIIFSTVLLCIIYYNLYTILQENARERLRMIQKILPPPSLGEGPLRELFKEQEQERYELRMKHVVEKEKLVLAVEQVS